MLRMACVLVLGLSAPAGIGEDLRSIPMLQLGRQQSEALASEQQEHAGLEQQLLPLTAAAHYLLEHEPRASQDLAASLQQLGVRWRAQQDEIQRIRAGLLASERELLAAGALAQLQGLQGDVAKALGSPERPLHLRKPVSGSIVARPQREPGTGLLRSQRGIELSARSGELVRAPAAGKVRKVIELAMLGQVVVLEHEGGFRSVLARLQQVGVSEGQQVEQGAALARVWGAACDPGCRIELQLWRGETPVDPAAWLDTAGEHTAAASRL